LWCIQQPWKLSRHLLNKGILISVGGVEEYYIEELLDYLFLKKVNLFKLLYGVLRLLGALP
jgi:hypothetical protein